MNILLVEDDVGLVELITVKLEESGFLVMSVTSGTEALAHLSKRTPDLMLLDYSLPDINGKELIETLNKQQTPLPPFIITTGQGDERIAVNMMKLGAMDYLVKDMLFLEKLPDVVQRVIKEIESDGKLKQAEEALKKSKERLSGFMASATDGFMLFDSDLYQVDINKAALKMIRQKREDVIGKNILQLAPDIEKSGRYDKYKEVIKTGKPITLDDIMPHSKFGNKHVLLKAFRVGQGLGMIVTDITEKKKAEEKIRAAEEKYRTMIETSNDIIWMLDHKSNFTFINAHAEKATGYLLNDLKGKSFIPLVLEDELPFLNEVFTKTMSGESISYEMSLKTVYGNTLILAVNTAPLSTDGEVQAMFSFARDITQQKEAERLLKESEKRFKALHNASFGGIAIHDMGIIKDCNQGLSDISGYTLEELIGMDGLLCIAENSRKIVKQNIKSSYEKAYEVIGLRKNGEEYPLRLEAKMIPYDGKNMRVVEFRDITEQKKVEDDVRRLSTAVKQSPSIIVITDTEGEVEYVNPKFTELTGYNSAEVIGQKSNIFKSGKQDTAFYKEIWKTINSGKVWRGQFHNKKKNGKLFWEAASISAIFNESGDIINYIKIGEDITQQKAIDMELKIALEKALESDRLKSAFLSNMSHEIRTPMNGILGFINLLNDPNLSKVEIDQYSSIINKSGKRLLNTINDIIDISKIEAGEVVISKTEISINDMMDELYSFYSPQAKQKGLSLLLESHLSNEQITIITDSNKLHGVLTNLIKNAIKYTDKGYITFGYLIKENSIVFFVKDTGIGVPKDRTQAIFNRFEQADIEDTMVLEGSGLGLAISKAYVEMLGGEIFVESDEGLGSKFTFAIPYVKQVTQEIERTLKKTNNDHVRTKKMNLLIVEDEEDSSDLLKIMLAVMFKKITTVRTGIDAIEICKNNAEIDLVLMDIKLPVMDGYTATRKIRKFNKDLVIIAQTAYALVGDMEKAIEAGCNDYIPKPINKKLLIEMIKKHVSIKSI